MANESEMSALLAQSFEKFLTHRKEDRMLNTEEKLKLASCNTKPGNVARTLMLAM